MHLLEIDPAVLSRHLAGKDILGHRHILENGKFLMHHLDVTDRALGRIHDLAAQRNLPCIGCQFALNDLQRGRFSRAVLTKDRMNLARSDTKADVAQRLHRAVTLADTGHVQNSGFHRSHSRSSNLENLRGGPHRSTAADARLSPVQEDCHA